MNLLNLNVVLNKENIMGRNKIVYILMAVALLVSVFAPLYGGDTDRLGTPSGVQLLVPVGPRDLAMGGANLAYTNGIEAIHWNPAGVSKISGNASAMLSTMTIFNDVNVNYMALGFNAGRFGNLAFSLKSFDFGDIPWTTEEDMDGDAGRTYSPSFVTLGLTYAKQLTNAISVGVTTNLIYESVPRASATAIGFDIGIQYEGLGGIEGVAFGIAVKNIGTSMRYTGTAFTAMALQEDALYQDYRTIETAEADLPALVEFGLGYKTSVMGNADVTVAGAFQNDNYGYDKVLFGGEYLYNKMLAVRAGYEYNVDIDSEDALYSFTLGAGFNYKLGTTCIGLDYVFRPTQYFDAENTFALRIRF